MLAGCGPLLDPPWDELGKGALKNERGEVAQCQVVRAGSPAARTRRACLLWALLVPLPLL